jgi:hypothetical protein
MNTPSDDQILEFILRQYEILWDRYEEGRQILQTASDNTEKKSNRPQLVEVSFDELSQNPDQTLQNIYKQIGWIMSPNLQAKLKAVVKNDVKTYKKNSHKDLDPRMKATLQSRWGSSFDRLGYDR